MEKTLIKISSGAIDADEHYIKTGHFIQVFGKKMPNRHDQIEYTKLYKCSQCDFQSWAGELIETWI